MPMKCGFSIQYQTTKCLVETIVTAGENGIIGGESRL